MRANELDSEEWMYFQTADLRTRLAEGNEPLLPPTPEVDQVVRRLLARQLRHKKAAANRARVDAFNARVMVHSDRVKEYNRRLAANNEARMREDAAGALALDARLRPALVGAIRDGLQRWESEVTSRLPNDLARDLQIQLGKAMLGQHDVSGELWTRPVGKGYARLVADWILSAGPRQSTNREYARHVAT